MLLVSLKERASSFALTLYHVQPHRVEPRLLELLQNLHVVSVATSSARLLRVDSVSDFVADCISNKKAKDAKRKGAKRAAASGSVKQRERFPNEYSYVFVLCVQKYHLLMMVLSVVEAWV